MPPLLDFDAEDEGPAPVEVEALDCGAAETAAFLVTEAAVVLGLAGREVVAERGSNLGALNPVEELAGRGSVLCLLTAGEPLLLAVSEEVTGAVATTAGRVDGTGAVAAACFGACLLSCCCVLFCANRALAVCLGRPAGEAPAGAKLSISPSSLSSILKSSIRPVAGAQSRW